MWRKGFSFIFLFAMLMLILSSGIQAGYYEPPINFFFIIHVENLEWGNYQQRIVALNQILELLSNYPNPPKLTILMNGDFIEYMMFVGDSTLFRDLEAGGHELGAHAHSIINTGPLQWQNVDALTSRYGNPLYNDTLTHQIWADATAQLDRLTHNKHTICAGSLLCSTEAALAQENGYMVVPGNRSEKCLDYTGVLMHHPMRYGGDDHPGYELQEDLSAPIIYLDHYAQIGSPDAHGYNCTFPYMMDAVNQCYEEWLQYESTYQDTLEYYVWTFGFLTHLWLINEYYLEQIQMFLNYITENYIDHYTLNGNLIAHFATANEIAQEFIAWEQSHPGWSSFNLVYHFPQNLKINELIYIPQGLQSDYEWVEIFNPTEQVYGLYRWRIRGAVLGSYWQINGGSISPGQYIVLANNGEAFYERYGFYPDYEAFGGTPAADLTDVGDLDFHDLWDAVILQDTTSSSSPAELDWVDAYSWGQSWHAGFCDTNITGEGHSIARDSSSTDTDLLQDWCEDGRDAGVPTPGQQNLRPEYLNSVLQIPEGYQFNGNYPNPFNNKTAFRFTSPVDANISLQLYNIYGQLVKSVDWGKFEAGTHFVQLSLEDLSSGVYLYQFNIGQAQVEGKIALVK